MQQPIEYLNKSGNNVYLNMFTLYSVEFIRRRWLCYVVYGYRIGFVMLYRTTIGAFRRGAQRCPMPSQSKYHGTGCDERYRWRHVRIGTVRRRARARMVLLAGGNHEVTTTSIGRHRALRFSYVNTVMHMSRIKLLLYAV